MRALTLHRPWDVAIERLGKDLENRSWPCPPAMVGHRFALHRGREFDERAAQQIQRLTGELLEDDRTTIGQVFATVVVDCVVTVHESRWFFGPYGWVLRDLVVEDLGRCRGFQGLWGLPPDSVLRGGHLPAKNPRQGRLW